jgi:hypothetical protein
MANTDPPTTQHRKLKRWATRTPPKTQHRKLKRWPTRIPPKTQDRKLKRWATRIQVTTKGRATRIQVNTKGRATRIQVNTKGKQLVYHTILAPCFLFLAKCCLHNGSVYALVQFEKKLQHFFTFKVLQLLLL